MVSPRSVTHTQLSIPSKSKRKHVLQKMSCWHTTCGHLAWGGIQTLFSSLEAHKSKGTHVSSSTAKIRSISFMGCTWKRWMILVAELTHWILFCYESLWGIHTEQTFLNMSSSTRIRLTVSLLRLSDSLIWAVLNLGFSEIRSNTLEMFETFRLEMGRPGIGKDCADFRFPVSKSLNHS